MSAATTIRLTEAERRLTITDGERLVLLALIDWYRRQNDPEDQMDMMLWRHEVAHDRRLAGLRGKIEAATAEAGDE